MAIVTSRCYRCREDLGQIVMNPTKRICKECSSVIEKSLVKFYAKAAVKKATKRAKRREGRMQ
ncbi:MAG: hypothetical protein ACKN9R_05170 [Candidatus Limnocylindrus sp.]